MLSKRRERDLTPNNTGMSSIKRAADDHDNVVGIDPKNGKGPTVRDIIDENLHSGRPGRSLKRSNSKKHVMQSLGGLSKSRKLIIPTLPYRNSEERAGCQRLLFKFPHIQRIGR
jgi:hypothetical protein